MRSDAAGSVIIPAHDEAAVIARCLSSLFSEIDPAQLEVVVVCNGCSDGTPDVVTASGFPVRVVEIPEASKMKALTAGDAAARSFPRVPGRLALRRARE